MGRIVVGFGHRRRRGKDLCCALAYKFLTGMDVPSRIDHFAFSLKQGIGKHVFGLTDDQLYGEAKFVVDPFWGETPRRLLQLGGTECMRRGYADDIWARTLERRAMQDPNTSILVGDVRFSNEVEAIKRLGGIVVRVDRDVPETEEDAHASETALADFEGWDHVILNRGSMDSLVAAVHRVVAPLVAGSQHSSR